MQKTFSVSVPAATRTLYPNNTGKTEVTFTVTNNRATPARASVYLVAKDGADDSWFGINGNVERDFGAKETQQYKVLVQIPPDTPAGVYNFRADVVNVANPQEDFAEGDSVSLEWKPAPATPRKPLPLWLIPVIALGLALALIVALLVYIFSGDSARDVLAKSHAAYQAEDWEEVFDYLSSESQKQVCVEALLRCVYGPGIPVSETRVVTIMDPVAKAPISVEKTFTRYVLRLSPSHDEGALDFFGSLSNPSITKEELNRLLTDIKDDPEATKKVMVWAEEKVNHLNYQGRKTFAAAALRYLRDEHGKRYLASGAVRLRPIPDPQKLPPNGLIEMGNTANAQWSDPSAIITLVNEKGEWRIQLEPTLMPAPINPAAPTPDVPPA